MGKLVIECFDRKIKLRKIARSVYKTLGQKAYLKAELVFSDGEEMTSLNRTARGVDNITDVLSFPSLDGIRGEVLLPENCRTELEGKYIFLGSIVLCDEKIKEQAKEFGHSEEKEREYLIVHGLMHLFGYDHMTEEDKKQMREKEKEAIRLIHEREILAQKRKELKAEKAEAKRQEKERKKAELLQKQQAQEEIEKEQAEANGEDK